MTLDTIPVRRVTTTDFEALMNLILSREIHLPFSTTSEDVIHKLRGMMDIPISSRKVIVRVNGEAKFAYRVGRKLK